MVRAHFVHNTTCWSWGVLELCSANEYLPTGALAAVSDEFVVALWEEASMAVYVGLDVGSVSAKLAAVWPAAEKEYSHDSKVPPSLLRTSAAMESKLAARLLLSNYRRTFGNPVQAAKELLAELQAALPNGEHLAIRVTGSGGRLVADALQAHSENEFKAIACSVGRLYPEVRTVFEIGGESSKYLRLMDGNDGHHATGSNAHTYATGIADYSTSGECAAGTGSFLDQQATRLKSRVEDFGAVGAQAKWAGLIAGRCSV